MAGEWQQKPLVELCSYLNRGSAPAYVTTGGVLVLNQKCVRDQRVEFLEARCTDAASKPITAERMLCPWDVVVNSTGVGTLGRVAQVKTLPGPATVDSHMTIVRPDPRVIDPEYLGLVVRLFETQIKELGEGSTGQTELSRGRLGSLVVPVAPRPEQRAIAHILGALDDKIELNRRMNETLEAMARALFKSWFVDFDPVRAKAEGRDPGLPADIAALFPDSFEDSELGEIPKGWDVKRLADLCSTQYGYTASAVNEPVGPKYLRVTDINKRNWIRWSDVPYCAIDADARHVYALHVGDLIVARMADPGKAAIIEEDIDAVFASYLVRLKTASLAESYYIYGFLKSDLYAEYAEGAKSGSVQANMNAKVIVDVGLVVPPLALMQQHLNVVLPLRRRLVASSHESHNLAILRDTLLPKLMSGELTVKDMESVT